MNKKRTIWLALLLSLPVILFVAHHYFYHSPDLKPTGFTVDENVLYMSYAQQYLDQAGLSVGYANPFDANPSSPRIYFQPITVIFAALLKLGLDPGIVLNLFHLLMTFSCIVVGIRIIRHLLPENGNTALYATLFTWGGGLTVLFGLAAAAFLPGNEVQTWTDGIYLADPGRGWWGLNWGRNLFLPLEAYYHFLFLLCIYFILKEKWKATTAVGLFLSISHPFTGIEYLLIINGWLALEKFIFKNKTIPVWFLIASLLIVIAHLLYYLVYLNSYSEHQVLFSQYKTGWSYSLLIAIPAYCIVAAFSLLHIVQQKKISRFLGQPHQRLFFCWAIIAFLLSKHEWFIESMQPIHFTRGYPWSGLFLFGLPALIGMVNYLRTRKLKWAIILLLSIFLLDNLAWTVNLLRGKNEVEWEGHITPQTEQVLDYLHDHAGNKDLILGNSTLINYLANIYSPASVWVSHPYNTPLVLQRNEMMHRYFETGVAEPDWRDRKMYLIFDKRKEATALSASIRKNIVLENDYYLVITP